MDFKSRFLDAIRAGKDDDILLRMARESATSSFDLHDVYEVMQDIWQDFGFDERSDGGKLQDSLEFVMEKIWYEFSQSKVFTR